MNHQQKTTLDETLNDPKCTGSKSFTLTSAETLRGPSRVPGPCQLPDVLFFQSGKSFLHDIFWTEIMFSLSVRLQFTKVLCKEPCLVVKPFSTGYGDAVRRTISSWSCLCVYHGRPWPRKREELDVWGKRTGKIAVEPTTLGGLSQKDIVQRALAFVYSKKLTPGIVSLNSVPSQESSLPSQRVNADLYNRNPRNAELMNVAMKRTGWELEATRKDFYNK